MPAFSLQVMTELRKDRERLDFLAELVKLPTVSFHFNDNASEEEMPVGFTIRVDESCLPAVQATGADLRGAIDNFKRAMERATATAEHGN